ncbi:unnamed protein product [Auanema sp. JU1783]|nr:unnamed protein product [Auanema sp. JU1783]
MKTREPPRPGTSGNNRSLRHNAHRRDEASKTPSQKCTLQLLTRPRENDFNADKDEHFPADGIKTSYINSSLVKDPTPKVARSIAVNEANVQKDKEMSSAKKLLNDSMSFEDFFNEYLSDNTSFDVIGAIGPQGAGKSTILSMLGGNDPQDMYRYYIFRPASREAIESSRYQTVKIFAYIGKSRTIFLDCQATNCSSVVEEVLRHGNYKTDDRADIINNLECIDIVALMLQVCQTILVCNDWLFDLDLIKMIRLAEGIRAASLNISGLPTINTERRVNLVFLHTKAKANDFCKTVLASRVRIIRGLFKDSKRIRIPECDSMVLIPLSDIKPRKDTISNIHSAAPQERPYVVEEVVDFQTSIRDLRNNLACLERDPFSLQVFSERQWFNFTKMVWKDSTFVTSLDYYKVSIST